jgi:hypothetical protein
VLESGAYYIGVGSTSDCRANPLGALCEPFQLALSSSYNAVCSAACEMWAKGVCGDVITEDTCASQCRAESWEWNYVDCLEDMIAGKFILSQCWYV